MPFVYTEQEGLDMVMCYRLAGHSLLQAQVLWRELHPAVRLPSRNTILHTVQRFREYGTFRPPRWDVGRPRYAPEVEEQVVGYILENPQASTRDAARVVGVSQYYAWRALRDEDLYPYHFLRVQEVLPTDHHPRVDFCQWLLEDRTWNILWTDEAAFTRIGLYNIHNQHWWATENPRLVRESHFQTRFSLNVWAGVIGHHILGPVFLPPRLTGQVYLDFLSGDLEELLDDLPVARHANFWYQHDGAPAHYYREVREFLNQRFHDEDPLGTARWIGRGRVDHDHHVPWPPRSPDLTPLDFYLWGRVKDLVYGRDGHAITGQDDLRVRIMNAFELVRADRAQLERVNAHIYRRAELCVQQNGLHFQQLLN